MQDKNLKVVVVAQMPTPYRVSLWDQICKDIDLNVICLTEKEKNRMWNVDNRKYIYILKSFHFFFEKLDWGLHFTIPLVVFFRLVKVNPSIIVLAGYDSTQIWEALFYAKIFRKKVIMWNGSTLLSSRSSSKIIYMLKKIFVSLMDGFYTYGTKATEYIKSFNATSKSIYTGKNTVDISKFLSLKSTIIYSPVKTILFVGQLIERKGLKQTIEALALLKNKDWKLLIIGSGSKEDEYKKLVYNFNLDDQISFLGYKQKEEILPYFEQSDIFLMPSSIEVWGLVLNEALASGLFCLSSKFAGATFDLIDEGENGYVIDPNNIKEYAQFLEKALVHKFDKKTIKEKAMFTIEREALKWIDFLKQIHTH